MSNSTLDIKDKCKINLAIQSMEAEIFPRINEKWVYIPSTRQFGVFDEWRESGVRVKQIGLVPWGEFTIPSAEEVSIYLENL